MFILRPMLPVRKIAFLVLLLFTKQGLLAQDERYDAPPGLNNAFIEMGGQAVKFSLNYEKYLIRNRRENITITGRVGVGYNHNARFILNKIWLEDQTFLFPFTAQALIGQNKEKLEVGAGFTLVTGPNVTEEVAPSAVLGLRVMETNGICFRITYTPMYYRSNFEQWLGVSLGYNFSFK